MLLNNINLLEKKWNKSESGVIFILYKDNYEPPTPHYISSIKKNDINYERQLLFKDQNGFWTHDRKNKGEKIYISDDEKKMLYLNRNHPYLKQFYNKESGYIRFD